MTHADSTLDDNNSKIDLDQSELDWLAFFEKRHKRPLRVLHIGNVANNAYINAKLQRRVGIDSYVITPGDRYIMDQPEWEDADFTEGWGDDFNPLWEKVDLKGYTRPLWFINDNNIFKCIKDLKKQIKEGITISRLGTSIPQIALKIFLVIYRFLLLFLLGVTFLFSFIVRALIFSMKTFLKAVYSYAFTYAKKKCKNNILIYLIRRTQFKLKKDLMSFVSFFLIRFPIRYNKEALIKFYDKITSFNSLRKSIVYYGKKIKKIFLKKSNYTKSIFYSFHGHDSDNFSFILHLIKRFRHVFPNRKDLLTENDLIPYLDYAEIWNKIFSSFDIIQCYGAHPMWGLLANSDKPYVSLEHGTLRDFTMGDISIHRIIALAYRESKHTFVTNGDCIKNAKKLGLKHYSPMIHPLDLNPLRVENDEEISALRKAYDANILLFCPIRHDWDIKGTDQCIKSLPLVINRLNKSVKLILCEWGKEVERSKKLINELNISEHIVWSRALPKVPLARLLRAVDVVLDQMVLPVFGSTAPQSLAAGTPVIMSYKPEATEWMFPEPAPILSAFSPEEIAECVVKALDEKWRKDFKVLAKNWIDKYHSHEFLLNNHIKVYREALDSK